MLLSEKPMVFEDMDIDMHELKMKPKKIVDSKPIHVAFTILQLSKVV